MEIQSVISDVSPEDRPALFKGLLRLFKVASDSSLNAELAECIVKLMTICGIEKRAIDDFKTDVKLEKSDDVSFDSIMAATPNTGGHSFGNDGVERLAAIRKQKEHEEMRPRVRAPGLFADVFYPVESSSGHNIFDDGDNLSARDLFPDRGMVLPRGRAFVSKLEGDEKRVRAKLARLLPLCEVLGNAMEEAGLEDDGRALAEMAGEASS